MYFSVNKRGFEGFLISMSNVVSSTGSPGGWLSRMGSSGNITVITRTASCPPMGASLHIICICNHDKIIDNKFLCVMFPPLTSCVAIPQKSSSPLSSPVSVSHCGHISLFPVAPACHIHPSPLSCHASSFPGQCLFHWQLWYWILWTHDFGGVVELDCPQENFVSRVELELPGIFSGFCKTKSQWSLDVITSTAKFLWAAQTGWLSKAVKSCQKLSKAVKNKIRKI